MLPVKFSPTVYRVPFELNEMLGPVEAVTWLPSLVW